MGRRWRWSRWCWNRVWQPPFPHFRFSVFPSRPARWHIHWATWAFHRSGWSSIPGRQSPAFYVRLPACQAIWLLWHYFPEYFLHHLRQWCRAENYRIMFCIWCSRCAAILRLVWVRWCLDWPPPIRPFHPLRSLHMWPKTAREKWNRLCGSGALHLSSIFFLSEFAARFRLFPGEYILW